MGFVKSMEELVLIGQMQTHFYDAEMLFLFWETRPEVVERLLPPPLEPAGYPMAMAFVANYPRTSFGPPYKEGALFLNAQFEGVTGSFCLSMPVTDDLAMAAGRERFGYPKKMAAINFKREGDQVSGSIERHGARFFEVQAAMDEQAVDEGFKALITQGFAFHDESGSSGYLFKHFLSPEGVGFDYPPRLIRQSNVFRPKLIEWGQAQVELNPCEHDPWNEVEIVNMLPAMYIVSDNTMLGGKVVAEVDPIEFMPYAFQKWDW